MALGRAETGANDEIDGMKNTEETVQALYARSDSLSAAGDTVGAYKLLVKAVELSGRISRTAGGEIKKEAGDTIIAKGGNHSIKRLEEELAERNWHIRILWIVIALGAAIIVAVIVVRKRIGVLKAREKDEKKKSERLSRQLVATQIAMEETSQVLEDVSKAVGEMEHESEHSQSGHNIANTIKTHKVRATERESFIDSFTALNPEFAFRLKGINSAITEQDIRIASYIVTGMESKRIATTLGIRPESVKQARWRLRTKLSIPKGASLEETLRQLNT